MFRTALPPRYLFLMLTPVLLLAIGTVGYDWLESEFTFFDSFYMTVITLTTVGFGEIPKPLSDQGRVFTVILLLGGVFTFFWAAGEMIRTIVNGEMQKALGRRRMERSLSTIKNHMIVCGYGRMGQIICREFSSQKLPFVVVDTDETLLDHFDLPGGLALIGDATLDDVLKKAGVDRARSLITVAGSDADNLFITLSARLLNEKLYIVARSEDEEAQQKLQRAGANRVVTPYILGGKSVAQAVLRPTVVEFMDLATRTEHLELQIEEVKLLAKSTLANMPIQETMIHQKHGIFIIAIKKDSGKMVYNPPGNTVLHQGDILIVLGHREELNQFAKIAAGSN